METTRIAGRLDLGGTWTLSVGGRDIAFVPVPGASPPIGECKLTRSFDSPWSRIPCLSGQRLFLVTEGVLAQATFVLNGQVLGAAGPWATYRFEVPEGLLQASDNILEARLRDLGEAFGPMPGRRFDCGLPRNIYLERRPQVYLEGMQFQVELSDDLSAAHCRVAVEINGDPAGPVRVTLVEKDTGRVAGEGIAAAGAPASFTVSWPRLWSPTTPSLYSLVAILPGGMPGGMAEEPSDELREDVGIRRLEVRGRDFYLNGSRLLLKGVCRHEFTTADGYAVPDDEVRRQLARIKHAGFNFVRLVHSPQAPAVPRIAAELGLLVSEEPGTCWQDLSNPAIAAPAVECLMRTVRRDRNVPSVAAFLIYNECNPDVDYAVAMAQACRSLSPGCLVGMADCSGRYDEIQAMVQAADLSFYGINLYSYVPDHYCQQMATFNDRPLVFTEWGGCLGQGNARLLQDLCENFVLHTREDESLRVAGCSFWVWSDYPEYSRPLPASVDGWTIEGLTDRQGVPRTDLQALAQMCFDMDYPPAPRIPRVEVLCKAPRRAQVWQPVPLDAIAGDQAVLEARIEEWRRTRPRYSDHAMTLDDRLPPAPRFGRLLVDGIEFLCRDMACPAHPLLLGSERAELLIPVEREVRAVAVLGHVTALLGYPYSAIASVFSEPAHAGVEPVREAGTLAAEYEFLYEGATAVMPLRHGLEILRANDICRWWMTEPRAPETRPAVRAVISPTYESLRVDLWEYRLPEPRYLKAIRWRLADPAVILLMVALSVQE